MKKVILILLSLASILNTAWSKGVSIPSLNGDITNINELTKVKMVYGVSAQWSKTSIFGESYHDDKELIVKEIEINQDGSFKLPKISVNTNRIASCWIEDCQVFVTFTVWFDNEQQSHGRKVINRQIFVGYEEDEEFDEILSREIAIHKNFDLQIFVSQDGYPTYLFDSSVLEGGPFSPYDVLPEPLD